MWVLCLAYILQCKQKHFKNYFPDGNFLRSTYKKCLAADAAVTSTFCFGVLKSQCVMGNRTRYVSPNAAREKRHNLSEGWSGLRWQTHTVFWSVANIYFWGFSLAKDVLQDSVSDRPLVWGPPAGVTCLRCSDSGKVQSRGSANTRAALPPDGPRESFFPLVCWQIAQLWCYMSALALRISRDKPGMFCMPGSGAEPLHWDNLLEGTMGPGWTRRVGNPLMLWAAAL